MPKRDSRLLVIVCAMALFLWAGAAAAQDHGHDHGHDAHAAPADQHDAHGHDAHGHDAHAADAHGDAHGEGHGDGHDDHGGGHFHLENLGKLLAVNILGKEKAEEYADWIDPLYSMTMALIIALFFISVARSLQERTPSRRQMFAEVVIGGLYDMFQAILGDQARRFAPYLGTLFIFIICNNLFGLIPLGHSATASFVNTTLALGLMTFCYVQYVGIKENGIGGYLYHFAGQPKSGIEWVFAIMIFPLEVMGELIKPISLSLRLFGNIFGEDTLIAVMVILGVGLMHFILDMVGAGGLTSWFPGFPFQVPFYAIALIGSTVQALVFTLLSTIYIALMLPHGHEDGAH
jgi:F-type H+-transporting ATPase subunit a